MSLKVSKKRRERSLSSGIFVVARPAKTSFGHDCNRKSVNLFTEALINRGIRATSDYTHRGSCGVDIAFDFTGERNLHSPRIVTDSILVEILDLEIAAQYIASWSRPVWGPTSVEIDATSAAKTVTFKIMSEVNDNSFIAFQRLENLLQDLAMVLAYGLHSEFPSEPH